MLDALILTPLDEEFEQMRACFDEDLTEVPVGSTTYWAGTHRGGPYPYTMALASMAEIGNDEAAAFVAQALGTWQPANVFLLGIAGSFDTGRHALGDVLISSTVYGYTVGDQELGGPRYRVTAPHVSTTLLDRARAIKASSKSLEAWRASCTSAAAALPLGHAVRAGGPAAHVGVTASGNYVVKSNEFRDKLRREIHPLLIGVEMEGKGLFTALIRQDAGVRGLMIRGISDFADEAKEALDAATHGAIRRYAAANATRLLRRVLDKDLGPSRTAPLTIEVHLDESPQLAMELQIFRPDDGAQHLCLRGVLSSDRPRPQTTLRIELLDATGTILPFEGACVARQIEGTRRILLEPGVAAERYVELRLERSMAPYSLDLAIAPRTEVQGLVLSATDEFGRAHRTEWKHDAM